MSEYKNEAFRAFEEMMQAMRSDICSGMFRSSTNLAAFENMLSSLSDVAKTTGPDQGGSGGFDRFSGPPGQTQPSTDTDAPEIPKIAVPVVVSLQKLDAMILALVVVEKNLKNVAVLNPATF